MLTLASLQRTVDALKANNRPTGGDYVMFVHSDTERDLHTVYARELGRPIRQHARRAAMRNRKHALMRDWFPTRLHTRRS